MKMMKITEDSDHIIDPSSSNNLFDKFTFVKTVLSQLCFQNIRVTSWEKFGRHACRTQATKIDFKKLIVTPGEEESWPTEVSGIAPFLLGVTQFEFQKISPEALQNLMSGVAKHSSCQINSKSFQGPSTRKLRKLMFSILIKRRFTTIVKNCSAKRFMLSYESKLSIMKLF
jgi:hypothetical protein